MGELKSAWEIAQEKANRLGKLSVEEMQEQSKQRCCQIGQGIAQKWLDGSAGQDLAAEINSFPEEEKELVKKATLSHLIQVMDLKGGLELVPGSVGYNRSGEVYPRLEKIIQGIASLEPKLQPTVERITKLVQEYKQAERERRQELESKGKQILHQLRISGTAVGNINIEATPRWQQSEQRLIEAFAPRLEGLKQELAESI